jgi:hypothetical protein
MLNREAHSNIVVWETMLQAGRSRVRVPFPIRSLNFFILLILPAELWPRGQLLTEMSTRNFMGSVGGGVNGGWPAQEADNLFAVSRYGKRGSRDVSSNRGSPRLLTRITSSVSTYHAKVIKPNRQMEKGANLRARAV